MSTQPERVVASGPTCDGLVERELGPCGRAFLHKLTNPGAACVKEYFERRCVLVPGHGALSAAIHHIITITTLGNGYLGSRIDEERSEMRYLV